MGYNGQGNVQNMVQIPARRRLKPWKIGLFDCCSSRHCLKGWCCAACLAADINVKVRGFCNGSWCWGCCCAGMSIAANGQKLAHERGLDQEVDGMIKTWCC